MMLYCALVGGTPLFSPKHLAWLTVSVAGYQLQLNVEIQRQSDHDTRGITESIHGRTQTGR